MNRFGLTDQEAILKIKDNKDRGTSKNCRKTEKGNGRDLTSS